MTGPSPGDNSRSNRVLLWIAAFAIALALVAAVAGSWLAGPSAQDVETLSERLYWLIALLFVFSVPILIVCATVWRIGARAARTGRYPPEGSAAIGRAPPVEGPAAVRRGRTLQALAVLVAVTVVALPLSVWYLVLRVTTGG